MSDDLRIPPDRELPPGRRQDRRAHLVGELRRPGARRRRRAGLVRGSVVGVVVLLVVTVGAYAAWDWWRPPAPAGGSGNYRWHFDHARDMVATSELVVLGQVTGEERGAVSDQSDVIYTARLLQVKVERRLFGEPAGQVVVVEDPGWVKAHGREVPWRVEGMIRLEVGDRAVLFLAKQPASGRFYPLNDQAAYRVEDADMADSDRADPVVRRVEAMSVDELRRLVDEAAADVRRGTLQPLPEGGRRRDPSPP